MGTVAKRQTRMPGRHFPQMALVIEQEVSVSPTSDLLIRLWRSSSSKLVRSWPRAKAEGLAKPGLPGNAIL